MTKLLVDAETVSDHSLLVAIYEQNVTILAMLTETGSTMAELADVVTSIQTAIDGVASRQAAALATLVDGNANLQAQLVQAGLDDAAAAAILAESNAAVAALQADVDRLNAMGAAPAEPVVPDPNAPVVDPIPVDPNA